MAAPLYSAHTVETIGEILNRKASVVTLLNQTASGLNHAFEVDHQSPEDLIFELFKIPNTNEASIGKLFSVMKSFGLREDDPRLKPMMEKVRLIESETEEREHETHDPKHWKLTREQFRECVSESLLLISQTLRNNLVVPSWHEFCQRIKTIFEKCKTVSTGKVATYIPQLARQDPNQWGVSICTVDGQRVSFGSARTPFCFQSVSKAFTYAIVASEIGADAVHSYVGQEPSGRLFNDICLDGSGKPHNPMVNSGAIIVSTLLKSGMDMADRFDHVLTEYKKLAGGEYIGFNNATFLSERDTADRNFALSYYMKEYECFPKGVTSVRDTLDFYFQLCSLETNCESASVMAATLANGGVCPLTGEKCLDNRPCRDVLSLMYSCGMYDYSGQFSFHVGLPAKSGVSGAMIVVVPNLMGICLWSPPLDKMGNTVRGVEFCKELIETFNFHNYDSLLHAESKKFDPRKRPGDADAEHIVLLLFAAKMGDLSAIRRFFMQGANLEMGDYDGRTALHLAASEGHHELIKFLLDVAKVRHDPEDRWKRTPLDDARTFKFDECMRLLLKAQMQVASKRSRASSRQLSAAVSRVQQERISEMTSSSEPEEEDEENEDEDDTDNEKHGAPPTIDIAVPDSGHGSPKESITTSLSSASIEYDGTI
uniref:glutaminase n=1 Tax=Plectus sambesii TaxID=2011161 RepID=A0A914X683_9BILA